VREVETIATDTSSGSESATKAWIRTLELTATIPRHRDLVMSTVIEELAGQSGDTPAVLSDRECLTYRALAERSNQYARWALEQGLAQEEVVCLLMTSRPEYFAV
jgi:fatty-acyl-CoA synthase